ncbi:hypothetical protein JOC37_000613 [Desulfohalotomaculum tongense]|uniref:LppX_LprAFG lipoprotein n=1 Tax=Desulforadius tongensis TaxID=1216062 RepID=UPI00195EDE4F|nr:LppX_LprAFG lipoprotein [Desulforadius tongensis]MBM7854240.1 hypothetical protein [Desulforadius tongensis]
MRLPQFSLNRFGVNKKVVLLALALAVIGAVVWGAAGRKSSAPVDPQQLLNTSLQKTLASKSYRFEISCQLGAKKEPISKIKGERVGEDRVHIKGSLINSPVEFVQYNDSTFMKDPFSGRWLTLQGNQLAKAESFIIEFNPLANFNFKDVPELKYVGCQELDGEKYQVLELVPNVELPFLENQFNTFKYKLWINPRDQRISRAVINASHSGNDRALMQIDLKLYDYDQEIDIKPPV